MNIKLNQLKIENLGGIKSFNENFEGKNAVIKAENRRGKTTLNTSLLWLFFNKNVEGKSHFELRPLNNNNQPIKGLIVSVEAGFSFDDTIHVFRKEQHELNVRGQLKGYTNKYWIDDVPKLEKDYNAYIAELIPEDTFKILTNLKYFSEELPWEKRRTVLMDIGKDNIGTPKGFDELLGQLKGRSIKDYKKMLSDQKKNHKEAQAKICPQIGENQRMLDDYVADGSVDEKTLTKKRDSIKAEIVSLVKKRQTLFTQELTRQKKIEAANDLRTKKAEREVELLSDTSGIQALLDKKADIEKEIAEKKQAVADANNAFTLKQTQIVAKKSELTTYFFNLNSIREEYKKVNETKLDIICRICGTPATNWPQEKLNEIKENLQRNLAQITERGNKIKEKVDTCKAAIEALENEHKQLLKAVDKAVTESVDAQRTREKRLAEIDGQIKLCPKALPQQDILWLEICEKIKQAEKQIGEPVSEQLQAIDAERTAKEGELEKINTTLAQSDTRVKCAARIKELGEDEKRLAQAIADVEKLLADIDQYTAEESNLIEEAVNSKFKRVKFKLFNQLLSLNSDGERQTEPCCEVMLDGKPYGAMSCGERIFAGIDEINTFSEHYHLSVPLFIDNAESMTLPIEATSQTIELYAQKGINKLTIEKKGENYGDTTKTQTTKKSATISRKKQTASH